MPESDEVIREERTVIVQRSQRNTDSTTNKQIDHCFTTVFSGIGLCMGHALCCVQTTRTKRVITAWLWISVAVLTTSFCIRFAAYGNYKVPLSPGDQRPLTSHLSSFMCDSLSIGSDVGVNTYMLRGKPQYNYASEDYTVNKSVVMSNLYSDRYYMLPGSKWNYRICYTSNTYYTLYFFVTRGKKNFDSCKQNPWGNKCKSTISIPLRKTRENCYDADADFNTMSGLSGLEDDYYFSFKSSDDWQSSTYSLQLSIQLQRTTYNLQNVINYCDQQYTCSLGMGLSEDVTPVVTSPITAPYGEFFLTASCGPRWWVYLIFFAVIPLCVGFLITISASLCCRKREITRSGFGPAFVGSGPYQHI